MPKATKNTAQQAINRLSSQLARRFKRLGSFSFCLALVAFAISFAHEFKQTGVYAQVPTYFRVERWLESAKCSRLQKNFLLVCTPSGLLPAEVDNSGDDYGHTLAGNVVSWFQDQPVDRTTFARFNTILNAIGLLAVTLALLCSGRILLATAFLTFGAFHGLNMGFNSADVTGAHAGIAGLALAPLVWWGAVSWGTVSFRTWLIGSLLCCFSISLALLFREPIGRASQISALAMVFPLGLRSVESRLRLAVLLGALALSSCLVPALFGARNFLYAIPRTPYPYSHGFGHSIYIGLGSQPNSLGISNDHTFATEQAKAVDPQSDYMNDRHFHVLWLLYLKTIVSHPQEVARIYLLNAKAILAQPFLLGVSLLLSLLALVLASGAAMFKGTSLRGTGLFPLYTFLFLYYLQGILVGAEPIFVYGGRVSLALIWAVTIERIFSGPLMVLRARIELARSD